MSRRFAAALLSLGLAWPAGAQQKDEKQRMAPVGAFDVGTCSAQPPDAPEVATKEIVVGMLLAGRPRVAECLVDPKSRGPAKVTKANVDATLAESGLELKVAGDNLSAEGAACVKGALESWTKGVAALDGKHLNGKGPIQARLDFIHNDAVDATVVMGTNDASDVAGAIRLAEPGWCDCFADWREAPPRQLHARLKLAKGKTNDPVAPSDVAFDPAGDPAADKVAACLKGKLMAMKFKAPATAQLEVPYPFKFVHSGVARDLPGATPDLQFLQFDLERGRANAEAAIAAGARTDAAGSYDTLVKTYKAQGPEKKPKKGQPAPKRIMIKDLQDGCAALLKADDRMTISFTKVLGVEQRTHEFAAGQKAKDPAWAQAEAASAQAVTTAQRFVDEAKKNRASDEGACPKVH